ncbi:MAG: Hsp20/alpha crystallin family protein [bacterium]|nr:Hsp20/alpha crystallin family protein [bacterium]
MDDETKNFFAELAGTDMGAGDSAEEETELEADKEVTASEEDSYEPALVKTAPISLITKGEKKAHKEKSEDMDIFDEEEGKLTIDVYQTPTEIVVESTIAGVKPENLDISINNESVTIRGKREKEQRVTDEDYFYQECYWGKFSRSIILPQEIDAENATAGLKNGVLTIRLPKLNRQKAKKLKVKLD